MAVDITGHDIIGLGFDICGNQQEGVFIKSVFSRGPARESGCIKEGDRIKCLNISFDNITLQDACDILNCASPYKMRMLLEKGVAPPKCNDKHTRSPAPRTLHYGSQLALVPGGSGSSINLSHQNQSGIATGGPFKTYIRRLANLVAPSNKRQSSQMNYRCRTPALNMSGSSNELLDQCPPFLGSAAARRNLFSTGVPLQGLDEDRARNIPAHSSTIGGQINATFDEARLNTSAGASQGCLSQSDSIGSNMRGGRYSVDSAEMFTNPVGSSTNDFNTDSSLDYQNRNADHRLHGPQFEHRPGQTARQVQDLRTVSSQNQLDSGSRGNNLVGARRQSVAGVITTGGSGGVGGLIKANSKEQQSQLEQTQSQPEIALRQTNERLSGSELRTGAGVDERVEMLPNSRSASAETRNGRFPMISSMSTPAVNLLGSSQQQDWRKVPSLRKKKQQHQELKESIREESSVGGDTSYAESTSKLVERRQEQSTGAHLDSTGANSRSSVTQIARVIESKAESVTSS